MSEIFKKAVKEAEKGLASLGEIPRKLGLNIPTMKDIEDILSIIGPQADIKAMVEESSRVIPALKKGDIPEALSSLGLAALAPFMLGIPGTPSGIRKGSEGLTSLGKTRKIKDTLLKEVERRPDFKGHAKDVYWTQDPITLKHVFNPDEDYAASIVATARHGPFETVDPVSPRILKSTKKQIYEATQKALENFPDKIKVYRMAEKDAPFNLEGVDSFTLDPNFSGKSLPWATDRSSRGVFREQLKENYKLTEYLVDKKDILAAPNALWKGKGTFDEYEVILRTDKLKGSEGLTSRNVGARLPTRLTESFPSNMITGPQSFNQPLKLREFAAKQIEQLGPEDAAKIIGEGEEGLPSLLYHITKAEAGKPFKKFKWRQQGEEAEKARIEGLRVQPGGIYGGISDYGDFLSTTLNPHSPFITSYGVHDKSRTLVGLGKVNKIFDFTNKKHVDSIIKPLEKKDLKLLEKKFPKYKKKLEKDLKDFRKRMLEHNRGVDPAELEPFIKDQKNFLRKQIKELNLDKKKKEIQDRWKRARDEMEVGGWKAIENQNIKDKMRKLGYDAFTTEESGTNVMLFNPNEQFVPLFDPLKKKSVGFSTGGGLSGLGEK